MLFRGTYQKGDVLLKQGELAREGYFVIRGCLRSYYLIDGEDKTTAFYTEAETVALLSPSEHFVSCVEDAIMAASTPNLPEAMRMMYAIRKQKNRVEH